MASLPVIVEEPSKTAESGESMPPRAKSTPTTSAPRRRPSGSAPGREVPRQIGKMPYRSRLFRGARRSRARPDRGGAGGVEPRLLRLLSEHGAAWSTRTRHRHLACQFTFACDNNADVVREPDMWDRARKIAKAMLDGQLWLPEVAKSTHYHAYWVRPSWVHEMKKMYKFGVHTFYRPRAWGDGSEAPSWGTTAETAEISAKLAEAAHSSAEQASAKRQQQTILSSCVMARHAGGARCEPQGSSCPSPSFEARRSADIRDLAHASISSATSKFGAEWVSAPDET